MLSNSYCHWCLCRNCSKIRCPRDDFYWRCISCFTRDFKKRSLDCDFFTHKRIKHYKIVRRYSIGFRIPKNLKEKLEERATENGRTLSNLIINILTDYILEIEKAKQILYKQ